MIADSRRFLVLASAISGAVLLALGVWIVWAVLHPSPILVIIRVEVVANGFGTPTIRPEDIDVLLETSNGKRISIGGSAAGVQVEVPPVQHISYTPETSNDTSFHYSEGCRDQHSSVRECTITVIQSLPDTRAIEENSGMAETVPHP